MLEVSRRSVMVFGASTVGAVAVGAFAAPAVAGGMARAADALPIFDAAPNSGLPVRSHFTGHEGETFVAVSESGSVAVVLSTIDDVPPALGTDDEDRFNLIFTQSGSGALMQQGIYELTHPSVPAATLFVSAVSATKKRHLQALVNRTA